MPVTLMAHREKYHGSMMAARKGRNGGKGVHDMVREMIRREN
jgi:hypothetical protein